MEDTHGADTTPPNGFGRPAEASSSLRIADPMAGVTEKFNLLKGEVDALQIAMMKQHTPWYRNVSTIISVLALLFSFGTTVVSYQRTEVQDIQARRAELRSMLQRLATLPKENLEVSLRYETNPTAQATLAGYVNQENAILVRQAAEMARMLPPDKVSATEFYAIGLALQYSYDNAGAREFLQLAITNAKNFNDEISALRSYANILFLIGQPEDGRIEYQKALGIFSRYPGYNEYTQKTTHIWTELSWAYSEANIGLLSQAQQHVHTAEQYLVGLSPGPGTDQTRKQIEQAKITFASNTAPVSVSGLPVGAIGSDPGR